MVFNVEEGTKENGYIVYSNEEHSFDTAGGDFSNISILINDISIGINSSSKKITQIWGYSPVSKWEYMSCPLPSYIDGSIVVSELGDMIHTTRVNCGTMWREYYNPDSGWFCLDSDNYRFCKSTCIRFFENAIALIYNKKILSLWLKVH